MKNRFETAIITVAGDITDSTADKFCREVESARDRDIEIRIDSPGGYVAPMTKMCSAIQRHRKMVTTVCTGLAASAACTIFLCGKKRKIVDGGSLMIHDAHCRLGYNASTRATSEVIAGIIAVTTKIDREQIAIWMADTTYFDAGHSLRLGLAHSLASSSLRTSDSRSAKPPKTASKEELRGRRERAFNEMMKRRQSRTNDYKRIQARPFVGRTPTKQPRQQIDVPFISPSVRRSMERGAKYFDSHVQGRFAFGSSHFPRVYL